MKKKDLVERLAGKGYTKKSATIIIDDFVRVIAEALIEGEEISIHGFGTFYTIDTKPRESIDCRSKERITIPSFKAPKFTAGALLKRWVREGFIRD